MRAFLNLIRKKKSGYAMRALERNLGSRPGVGGAGGVCGHGGSRGAQAALELEPAEAALPLRPEQRGEADGGNGGAAHRPNGQTELTACPRGMVWNTKDQRCLARHSGVRPGARTD